MTPSLAKDDFATGQGKGELSHTPHPGESNPAPFNKPNASTDPTPSPKKAPSEAESALTSAATEPTKPVSYEGSKNCDKNLIKEEILSTLKSSQRGRGSGFCKEEILFLAKAYIRASSDPIFGTSQTEEAFYTKG